MTTQTKRILRTCTRPECGYQWFSKSTAKYHYCPRCRRSLIPKMFKCRMCGHEWHRRVNSPPTPRQCPKCSSVLWNRQREGRAKGSNYALVTSLRKASPCMTLQTIADKVGVSRERVRQILAKQALPTRHYTQKTLYVCLNCGKETDHKEFCSSNCRYEYGHPFVECLECHTLFRKRQVDMIRSNERYKHIGFFCCKECQGRWLGKHHKNGVKRIHDYNAIWQKHLETGLNANQIAKLLNITPRVCYRVFEKYRAKRLVSNASR